VNVNDRRSAGDGILMHDRKRRRRYFARIGAELGGNGAREKCLSGAEVADEMDGGIARQDARDLAAGGDGFRFVAAKELFHNRIITICADTRLMRATFVVVALSIASSLFTDPELR